MKLISDSLENILNISQTNSVNIINSTNGEILDNQSYAVFQIGVNYENNLQKSPQLQYQKQSKIADNESDSLPIPWIAAIIINAILVFLFIAFVIYCYCRSKKRRRRNPDKDSLFSSKSSKHSVQEVQAIQKESTKADIFNIESEHKRLTEDSVADSPALEKSRKTSIKSPMNKVRTVTRLSGGARSSVHEASANGTYNPTDSPSVSQFTNQLNGSVPNPSQYIARHEGEEEGEQMEPLTENDDDMIEGNDEISLREQQSSPSRSRTSSPKQMPSSPSKRMSPSLTTTTTIMSKVKGMTTSPRKSASPDRRPITPGSPHSSHSKTVQTSPTTSWANIPGAVDDGRYFDERSISLRGDTEKKYFLYIIKDVNPFTKKECIGRITLPVHKRMTLEQLRDYLLQSDDETIRNCAKRRFKFLSESYRLVVMNESFTPVDQIYQTQGIFIKFSAGESVPFAYRSKNKFKAARALQGDTNLGYNRNKTQLDSVTRNTRNLSQKTDSIYGSTPRSTIRKESIYGSYGMTPRSTQKTSIYGSSLKSSDKSRFGFEKTPKRREEIGVSFDRTPRRYEEKEFMTISPQSVAVVSPRSRMRLCQKMHIRSQLESGQLEEMPSSFTSSLESVCDNPGCTNKPLLKCLVCTRVNYCSPQCKREHWSDHKFICKKPPWKG